MKRIIVVSFCMVFCLSIGLPAWSAELTAEAVQAKKVPASYATVKEGKIVFGKSAIAYSPDMLDTILTTYGGTLSADSEIPASYATVKEEKIVFGKSANAYSPDLTNGILTAYGFKTTHDAMAKVKDPSGYAKVEDGEIIFGKSATIYSPEEFNMLMAVYQLSEMKVVVIMSEPDDEQKLLTVANEPKTIILAFEDIHFDFDQSTLKPEAKRILKRNIRLLMNNPEAHIRVAGYTSASGTDAYNQKLSERRSKVVREYLISEGVIKPGRLSTIGYGEKKPAMYEAAPKEVYSKAAKANMRVLFEIIVQ